MQAMAHFGDAFLRKEALPLKRHLNALDASRLAPEYELHGRQPPRLNEEMTANLGTEEYLQWNIRERRRAATDPASTCMVFITYNTGKPDMVPHNPRECIVSSGWNLISDELITMRVARPDGRELELPVAFLEFQAPTRADLLASQPARRFVMFFFESNGKYCTTREQVRSALGNPFDRYAYYLKFEMCFVNADFNELAGRDASRQAGQQMLQKLMPILWQDHLQDWSAVSQGAAPLSPGE